MKEQQLSPLQSAFIIGNFIFSTTFVSTQQIVIEISKQNAWLVILLSYPITLAIVWLICRQPEKLKKVKGLFDSEEKRLSKHIFLFVFFFFLVFIFIRDFRSLNGFINGLLLPSTPIDIISILTLLSLIYISLTGIEVIARITVIHFFTIFIILASLPVLFINELQFSFLLPLGGMNSFQELMKSTYIFVPWMGEMIILIFLLEFVNPLSQIKRAGVIGVSMAFTILFILVFLNITVLGVAIASEATYPNIALIQQINLTDFLDRLDLLIVVVWIPTILCKLSLLLFGVQKTFNAIRGTDSDFCLVPLAFILGSTIHLFESNIDLIEFSFFTWPTQGLIFETIILLYFLFKKNRKSQKA